MAVNASLKSATASMKLQAGGDTLKSVSIPGLVKSFDAAAVFTVAQAVNQCQSHPMQQMNVTQTTVYSVA